MFDADLKFFPVLDRLTRDSYKYVQCCLQCLVSGIEDLLPAVFQMISEELAVMLKGGRSAAIPSEFDRKLNRSEFETLHGNLVYIAIITELLQAQIVKQRIVNKVFIQTLASYIDNVEIYSF